MAILSIEVNLQGPLSVPSLARQSGLSVSRFRHLFTREVGVSPGKAIKSLRMAKAMELLKDPRLSVKEVMARVGLNDKNHFRRDFKTAFGEAPSAMRSTLVVDAAEANSAAETAYR